MSKHILSSFELPDNMIKVTVYDDETETVDIKILTTKPYEVYAAEIERLKNVSS